MNPYRHIMDLPDCGGTSAQEQIRSTLLDLLERKPLSEISVKELCSGAYVARSTFYYYYQNTDEVLSEIENGIIYHLARQNSEIMDRSVTKPEDMLFYQETVQYVQDNRKVFYLFLIGQPNYRFIEKWKQAVKYHLWERLFCQRVAKNEGLILEMAASLVISAYTYCLKNPYDVDWSEICEMVSRILQMLDYES